MSVVINTNTSAAMAATNLDASTQLLHRTLNRLSSGTKIVNPSDDAGGLAVSMKLAAKIDRQRSAAANLGNSVSFLQTQDGALKVADKLLSRIGELKVLSADPIKNAADIANYDAEFAELKTQLSSLGTESFNGIALFSSSSLSVPNTADGDRTIELGGMDLTGSGTDVDSVRNATNLAALDLTSVKDALQEVATHRATNGAQQSRIGFATEVLKINQANLEAANSRITDVDVATESTQLARYNILVQAGTAMLSQANQNSQAALRLLG